MNEAVREFMSRLGNQLRSDAAWWKDKAVSGSDDAFKHAASVAEFLAAEIESNAYSDQLALSLFTFYEDQRTSSAVNEARIRVTESFATFAEGETYGEVDDFVKDVLERAGFGRTVAA